MSIEPLMNLAMIIRGVLILLVLMTVIGSPYYLLWVCRKTEKEQEKENLKIMATRFAKISRDHGRYDMEKKFLDLIPKEKDKKQCKK